MYYTYTAAVLMVLLHDAADDGDDDGDDGLTHQIPQTMAEEFDGSSVKTHPSFP